MECDPEKIIFDQERGEYICTETGEVIEERVVDQGPEWRAFEPERARAEALTEFYHDRGISTVISWRNAEERIKAMKLSKVQKAKSSAERTLINAIKEIERIGDLPKAVKEEAIMIFRKAHEKKIVQGRSAESVLAAAVYIACRRHRIAVSIDEISEYFSRDKTDVAKNYRVLIQRLKIKVPPEGVKEYIMKFAEQLKLSMKTIAKAIEIAERAKEAGVTSGKDAKSIAAAAIYVACLITGEKRTQKEISEASGVSDVTIRNRYKEIKKVVCNDENPCYY